MNNNIYKLCPLCGSNQMCNWFDEDLDKGCENLLSEADDE